MSTRIIPAAGDVVTGAKFAGRSPRRLTITVTRVDAELGLVHGLWHYAGTLVPGATYEGAHRGVTTLALESVEVAP